MESVVRTRALAAIRGVLVVFAALALAGCSSEPAEPAASAQSIEAAPSPTPARFPSPPGSRSIASSVEPGVLAVPLGPAGEGADAPMELVEADVRRRMNVLGMDEDGAGLADFYRAHIDANGYEVLFECEGLDACGGPGLVSAVAETFLTQPRGTRLASMVTGFMQPQTGFVLHYSLRGASGEGYVTVTAVRSDAGPVTVLTQATQ